VQVKSAISATIQQVDGALQLLHSKVGYMMMYMFKDFDNCLITTTTATSKTTSKTTTIINY